MAPGLRVAVLVSGEGTTLEGLASALRTTGSGASVVAVIADRAGIAALERARQLGLDPIVLPLRHAETAAWSESATRRLREREADLVVLAGFLSVLPAPFLADWEGRVVNVHPSLLPEYGGPGMYGLRVHDAVLRDRRTVTGATVHLVTEHLDAGPILAQARLDVRPGDTATSLRDRLRPVEVGLLLDVVLRFASGAWRLPYRSGAPGVARPAPPE